MVPGVDLTMFKVIVTRRKVEEADHRGRLNRGRAIQSAV